MEQERGRRRGQDEPLRVLARDGPPTVSSCLGIVPKSENSGISSSFGPAEEASMASSRLSPLTAP